AETTNTIMLHIKVQGIASWVSLRVLKKSGVGARTWAEGNLVSDSNLCFFINFNKMLCTYKFCRHIYSRLVCSGKEAQLLKVAFVNSCNRCRRGTKRKLSKNGRLPVKNSALS